MSLPADDRARLASGWLQRYVRCPDPSAIERVEVKPFNRLEWEKHYPEGRGKLPGD